MRTLRTLDGAIGGIVAGMAMAMVAMMYAFIVEGDLLAPLKQMAAVVFPVESASPLTLAFGMMLHVATAAILGVVFVQLTRRVLVADWPMSAIGFWPLAALGMIYIGVEWAVASFVILPLIDQPLLKTFASVGGLAAHAMYGVVLAGWLLKATEPTALRVPSGNERRVA